MGTETFQSPEIGTIVYKDLHWASVNKDPFKWGRGTSRHLLWILWKLLRKFIDISISSVHAIESRHLCTSGSAVGTLLHNQTNLMILKKKFTTNYIECMHETNHYSTDGDGLTNININIRGCYAAFFILSSYRFIVVYLISIIYTQIFHEM